MSEVTTTYNYTVTFAYWGWNIHGSTTCPVKDITRKVQGYLDLNCEENPVLPIYHSSFGPDPAPGQGKAFTAIIAVTPLRNGVPGPTSTKIYCTGENSNLDLITSGGPTSLR